MPMKSPFFVYPVVVYFAKDYMLARNFTSTVLRLHAAGIVEHIFQKNLGAARGGRARGQGWGWGPGSRRSGGRPKPLNRDDLAHVLGIVVKYALPLPFVSLLAEFVIRRQRGR